MSRGHVGLIAFYFPPSRASGVYRMLALANHLVECDFEVTVFTVTPDFFEHITQSSDESLLGAIDPRIRVERVGLPMQHLETHPRRFKSFRGNFPELHRRLTTRAIKKVWLDQYGSWVPGLLARMTKVHRKNPLDVVVATGNPYSCYQAPWLFKKATGVPYVLDSRDSWTLDLFTDELAFPPGHPAYTWEARTFADAERICFVNTPLLAWHQRTYPEQAD
ncbi:MAG: glycosyltransferase, partial [Mobilicoccus sp.]|nr:glycosyltransferase [Mobilicoccus sp.]